MQTQSLDRKDPRQTRAVKKLEPSINPEVQHRRSTISVVRAVSVCLAGGSRRRGGRGVRRREGVARPRANAPAAAKNLPRSDAWSRRSGTPFVLSCDPETRIGAARRRARASQSSSPRGGVPRTRPASRAGSRVRLRLRGAGPRSTPA